MTIYTAIGKYEFRRDKDGNKLPVIIAEEKEYTLDIWEMILWSSLIWNIYTYDEITKIFYKKEREVHILGELSCDTYIDRLENVGLIVSGHGITAADALHDLLSKLYVIPVKSNLISKSAAFLHLTLIKRVPYKVTMHIFDKPQFSTAEAKVMKLSGQNRLSVGELIKCVECGIVDVSTNDKLMDSLYTDDITTYKNIGVLSRTCGSCNSVLEVVATLYLNKHILFEK
jgi:hypothetical protein